MQATLLRSFASIAMLVVAAVALRCPSYFAYAAPPKAEDEPVLFVVRSKADVQALKDPVQVHAKGLDSESLNLLLGHQTLRFLTIQAGDLTEAESWKKLGRLKQLVSLSITDHGEYKEEEETANWGTLLRELKDSPVERIKLDRVYDTTQEWLARFADVARLKYLELPELSESNPTAPPEVPRWELESLQFSGSANAYGLDSGWLAFLGKQPKLTSLGLSRAKLDDAGCKGLAASSSIRALRLDQCIFAGGLVPDSFKFDAGLDLLEERHSLEDRPLAKLISLNVPKAISISCGISVTGQWFADVADWSRLEELKVYEHSDSKWSNEHIIGAFPKMTALRKVALQGKRLTSDAVVEAFLARSPKEVTLWDAEDLSPESVEKLVESTFIESLIVDGLSTITANEAQKQRSRFLALREGVPNAKCELQVKESH